jgi:hypothetical protein
VSIIDHEGVIPMDKKKAVNENSAKTFADVIAMLQDMGNLSKTRRRDLISALKSMARFIDMDISLVPANTEWLRQRLRRVHTRQLRVSEKHFQNVKSAVISALKMTNNNNTRLAAFPKMSSEFEALYQSIPDRMMGYKLSRFSGSVVNVACPQKTSQTPPLRNLKPQSLRRPFTKTQARLPARPFWYGTRCEASFLGGLGRN